MKTSRKRKSKKTRAYRRFKDHYWRTEQLLSAGLSGLEESRKFFEGILDKFDGIEVPRGRPPKNYKPSIKSEHAEDGDGIKLSMDDRSAVALKKVLSKRLDDHKALDNHYFSILAVSIWGSYETYIYMLFEELFESQPKMLKTKEILTFKDAIDHKVNIEKYLTEITLDKIGHFTLKESLSYLSDKVSFKFSRKREENLHSIYLIRNIIAHNSGILRPNQDKQLPKEITVKNRELRISKTYLKRMLSTINASIDIIEKHIEDKFFK